MFRFVVTEYLLVACVC